MVTMRIWRSAVSHPLLMLMVLMVTCPQTSLAQERRFDMDRLATCGQDIKVFDNDVVLHGRSNAAPANPPLECTVYLTSGYTETDGRYRLQIIIEAIDIQDCQVHVDVFNGRGAFGSYLRSLGCNSMSTDTLYTTNREATVRFSRPSILYQTAYAFTFKIRTYKDIDEGGYDATTNRLSPGAIIGIIVGIVALFVVGILLLWCYKTGRIGGYYGNDYIDENLQNEKNSSMGEINSIANLEKSESLGSAIDHRDPGVWSSVTNGLYNPGQAGGGRLGRNFYQQRGATDRFGRQVGVGAENGYPQGQNGYYSQDNRYGQYGQQYGQNGQRLPSDNAYEPYERDTNVKLGTGRDGTNAEWSKEGTLDRDDKKRASTGSKHGAGDDDLGEGDFKRDYSKRGSRGSRGSKGGEGKRASFKDDVETDVKHGVGEDGEVEGEGYGDFARDAPGGTKLRSSDRDSTRGSRRSRQGHPPGGPDDATMDAVNSDPLGGPPSDPQIDLQKEGHFFPGDSDSPSMKRANSMDLQSEIDSELMNNPEFASIPKEKASPSSKKRKKKKKDRLPPEAFDPVFTTPVSETPFDPSASMPYTSYGAPSYDAMYPYGMMPMAGMVPMPGQTLAYYQMGPQPGAPATHMPDSQQPTMAGKAAWYVQDTPQGPVQKGFMVTSESPNKKKHRGGHGAPGAPDYHSTPANELTPKRGRKNKSSQPMDPVDMAVLAAGGPPPEPGAGQRSAVMKKGIEPDTGMSVNQIMWRDTIVDPSDPPPEANPQITRKTLTRITTRSGHGNLPTEQNPMAYDDYSDRLGFEAETPGFLSPSRQAPALPPAANTPDSDNTAFYLGQGRGAEPVIHNSNSRSNAFRDRITMGTSDA